VFNRLGNSSQRSHSPAQNYSAEALANNRHLEFGDEIDFEPVRIVVRNDNYQGRSAEGFNSNRHVTANDVQAEIIYSIRHLEQKNRDNLRHIHGVRMTVENYQREIYKLEQIVESTNQEIQSLKARLNFM
jgi:phage shock protein A